MKKKTAPTPAPPPPAPKKPLRLLLHARLKLPGDTTPQENLDFLTHQGEAFVAYFHDSNEIQKRELDERKAKLDADRAKFAETPAGKYWAVIDGFVRQSKDRLTPELILKKRRALKKIGIEAKHILHSWQSEREAELLDWKSKLNDANGSAWEGIMHLFQEVLTGPDEIAQEAVKNLFPLAIMAARALDIAYQTKPAILKAIAPKHALFPCVATRHPHWPSKVKKMLADVHFAEDSDEANFTEAAYDDLETYPCRAYARALVDCIRANQKRMKEQKLNEALFRLYRPEYEVELSPVPDWATECATLREFNRDTAPQWHAVGRKILRAERGDFHTRPEWGRYVKRFEGLGKGEIQNRLFDLIESAMRTIAVPAPPEPA